MKAFPDLFRLSLRSTAPRLRQLTAATNAKKITDGTVQSALLRQDKESAKDFLQMQYGERVLPQQELHSV
jgi:hypothetical protein